MKLTRRQLKKMILETLNLNEGKYGWSHYELAQMNNYDITLMHTSYIRDAFFQNVSGWDTDKIYNKKRFNSTNEFIDAINKLRGQPGYHSQYLDNKAIMHIRNSLSGSDDEVLTKPSRRYQDEPSWKDKIKPSQLDMSDPDIFE